MKTKYQFYEKIEEYKKSSKYIVKFMENSKTKTISVLLGNGEVIKVPQNFKTSSNLKFTKKNQDLILECLVKYQNSEYIKFRNKLSLQRIVVIIGIILSLILGLCEYIIPTIILGLTSLANVLSTISIHKNCKFLENSINTAFKDFICFEKDSEIWSLESETKNLEEETLYSQKIFKKKIQASNQIDNYEEKKSYYIKPVQE